MLTGQDGLKIIADCRALPHQPSAQDRSPQLSQSMSCFKPPQHQQSFPVYGVLIQVGLGSHFGPSPLEWKQALSGGLCTVFKVLRNPWLQPWSVPGSGQSSGLTNTIKSRQLREMRGSVCVWGVREFKQHHCSFSPSFCIKRSISCLIHLKILHFSVCVFGKNRSL